MKTDWNKIKLEYIEGGETTQVLLAAKCKVNALSLKRHAAKEGWTEARKLFQAKVQNLRTDKRSEILASESAQFDSDCLKIARAALGKIVQELKGDGPTDKSMAALEKAQKIGRLAMGEQAGIDAVQELKITVTSEKAKSLTESIIKGQGTD